MRARQSGGQMRTDGRRPAGLRRERMTRRAGTHDSLAQHRKPGSRSDEAAKKNVRHRSLNMRWNRSVMGLHR